MNLVKPKIKLIEAFGGIGTFRKALENIGFEVETRDYIEWWKYAVDAYNQLHDNSQKEKDIREYDWKVDLFAHGSPCTDFSLAGLQDISKGRSILYMEVLRLIEDLSFGLRPRVIIWENVKNLLSKKHKPYFDYYINKLNELGYESKWDVLNSKDFGIPQSRERVFVVSIKKDENLDFDFKNLVKIPAKPLKQFLHNLAETASKLWFTNDKLAKAIQKGYYKEQEWTFNKNENLYLPLSGRLSDNKVGKDITAPLQANNNQTKVIIPLTGFKTENDIGVEQVKTLCARDYESPAKVTVPVYSVNKDAEYTMSDGSPRPIGKINKEGKITMPISGNHTNNKVGVSITSTLTTTPNAKVLLPLELEEYTNYYQLPRELDGKAGSKDKANGIHNRYYKTDKFAPALLESKIHNILEPIKNKAFNERGKTEIHIENNYQQESRIYDTSNENSFIDTLTTNLKSSKLAIPISKNGFNKEFKIKIPHQNYLQVDTVVKANGVTPTLTENHGWSQKIAVELKNELTFEYCQNHNIAIFNIDGKLYAIRHLSHIEYWRLMGWIDEDILKVKLPKTKMYFLAGNAIVVQVLEAIFKELFKNLLN